MTDTEFPNIDTSFWLTSDRAWVKRRKQEWEKIELYFRGPAFKSKKGINIIKRYYLKGAMPDFEALKEWNSFERHLDLFCFLWLHPSWDPVLLKKLRDQYVNSPTVCLEDVQKGIALIMDYGALIANQEKFSDISTILYTGGHNKLLFEIIMGDMDIAYFPEAVENDWKRDKFVEDIRIIFEITRWLCNKDVNLLNEDCLYQYDSYLEYWYRCCPGEGGFFEKRNIRNLSR